MSNEGKGWLNLMLPGWDLGAIFFWLIAIGVVITLVAVAVGMSQQAEINENSNQESKEGDHNA